MNIHLFGSTNPTGSAFLDISKNFIIHIWGRNRPENFFGTFNYCDLSTSPQAHCNSLDGILVSFAPIWLIASFIQDLYQFDPRKLSNLRGVIACSSSSFMTKRFAFSEDDKKLVFKLSQAHHVISTVCQYLNIPYQILAPTLVYGRIHNYSDKNLSKIIHLMQKSPFIILPNKTGLRQPIHASQLAKIAYYKVNQIIKSELSNHESPILPVGGDSIISYKDMIVKLVTSLDSVNKARKCKVVCIPDRLYFLIAFPILLINPKLFEALLRVKSNMSDFTMAHQVLDTIPQEFPVLAVFSDV